MKAFAFICSLFLVTVAGSQATAQSIGIYADLIATANPGANLTHGARC